METTLDPGLVGHSLSFHGQQLQKIWESELGEGDLAKHNVTDLDFSVYQQRQKQLGFQDRGKRLKLHQFIVRKAEQLFDTNNLPRPLTTPAIGNPLGIGEEDQYAVLPPFETFLPMDKAGRLHHFFQCVQPGELLICSVTNKGPSGLMLKVLCTDSQPFRYVADLNARAFCPVNNMPAGGIVADKKGISRTVMQHEAVRVELLEVVPDSEKLIVCMLPRTALSPGVNGAPAVAVPQLGLVYTEDLPTAYKRCQEHKGETYSVLLEKALGFRNPSNTELLAAKAGIKEHESPSLMKGLGERFPEPEYAKELRQVQASKWAFRSVAEGITHFKNNRHSEAFQCLNRALNIDPRNVEGLVARGALFANSGSYQKAIEDFENSLKLNPNHLNARKYMGETLVALGRSYEDSGKIDEALKAYNNCLGLVPYHEEAKSSIEYLENKIRLGETSVSNSAAAVAAAAALVAGANPAASKMAQDPHAINPSASSAGSDVLLTAGLTTSKTLEVKATLKQLLKAEQEEKDKGRSSRSKKKKDRKHSRRRRSSRKRRRRDRSSSSSSSSSSTASASSSSSSSSSSGQDSASSGAEGGAGAGGSSRSGSASPRASRHKRRKSKKAAKESHREKSLSPLSKRMALMEPSQDSEGLRGLMTQRMSQYNLSFLPYSFEDPSMAKPPAVQIPTFSAKELEYENRVRKFLEQTKGDSEYEDKVRKFLEETAIWKKERKAQEKDSKKKKKKDKSKSRDKEKSKKKKSSKEEDKRRKRRSRKSGASLLDLSSELGEASLAKQLEGLDEPGRRLVKEALLHKQLTAMSKEGRKSSHLPKISLGSESSSEEEGVIEFSSSKKIKDKSSDMRMLELGEIPDLGDLESKLSAYYAKIEKDKGLAKRSEDKEKKTRASISYPDSVGKSKGSILSPKVTYIHNPEDDDDDDRDSEKRKMDMFADSPTPPMSMKPKLSSAEATNIVSSKWKMQITPTNSKVKRREQSDKEPWEEFDEKRYIMMKESNDEMLQDGKDISSDEELSRRRRRLQTLEEKLEGRKAMLREQALAVTVAASNLEKAKGESESGPKTTEAYYDKFSGFRIARKDDMTKNDSNMPSKAPPTPVPIPPAPGKSDMVHKGFKTDSENEVDPRKKRPGKEKGKSRSGSRSSRSTSRSRRGRSTDSSVSGKRRHRSRSRSYRRRTRSGSRYRSRSRSYYRSSGSRSRSRSYDRSRSRSYYSRSRSRSGEGGRRRSPGYYRGGSRSPERYHRRYDPRGGGSHRYPRQRGTYYRPRFQNYKTPRGNYVPRGGRGYNPRGSRNYVQRSRGRGRPRFFHNRHNNGGSGGYRPDHHRRYGSEERHRSRHSEDRRSYEPDHEGGDRERSRREDEERKPRNEEPRSRREPISDREERETAEHEFLPAKQNSDYIDRKVFEGKWAEDKDEEKKRADPTMLHEDDMPPLPPPIGGEPLPENSIEEMDKFLNKVKAQKKEEMKERNKVFMKPTAW